MLSYKEAIGVVLHSATRLSTINVPIGDATGRYLAAEIISRVDMPRFDNSQMDGFAVRLECLPESQDQYPFTMPVATTVAAGQNDADIISEGFAAKIFTGAKLPTGLDTIIPIEDADVSDNGSEVTFSERPSPGQFVRYRGEDLVMGEVVGQVGDRVTPGRLAMIAAAGWGTIAVTRQPRVVILTNGDELIDQSVLPENLKSGQIYESNGVMLDALARDAGAEVLEVIKSGDSRTGLRALFERITSELSPDLIVSTGGVSVGDRDFIRSVLSELGEVTFWRVAIRPGKPLLFGSLGKAHFFGLPGNPASTMATFELFARPLIAKLAGSRVPINFVYTIVSTDISHEPGRRSFVRCLTRVTRDGVESSPVGGQASHFVTSLAKANSLLVLPENAGKLPKGSVAQCLITGPLLGEETSI
jgi:molybdopterin molybdotransferase